MQAVDLNKSVHEDVVVRLRRTETVEAWRIPSNTEISRLEAYRFLCLQRGWKFDLSLLSKWCSDFGIPKGTRYFNAEQFVWLQRMNLHCAMGGKREEILSKFEQQEEECDSRN